MSALLTGLLLGAAALTGCQSEMESSRSSALNSAEYLQESLATAPAQIDAVTKQLTVVTAGDTVDRKKALAEFDREVRTLETHALSMARARDNAENRTQEYFRNWLKQTRKYKTAAERDAAIAKYDAGQANVSQALEYLRMGARNFRQLMDELNGAKTSLNADLGAANVAKVRTGLGPVYDHAIKVKAYIERLDEQINASLTSK